jgi:spermidine/putrescine transport system ATP-binding protein
MADRIAVMQSGRIAQIGSAEHIYTRPATRFVAHFIGDTNIIPVTVRDRAADGTATLEGRGVRFQAAEADVRSGETRTVSLRPEKIRIASPQAARGNGHAGRVLEVTFLGPLTRYEVALGEDLRLVVQAQTESEEHFRRDDAVSLSWPSSAPVVLKD